MNDGQDEPFDEQPQLEPPGVELNLSSSLLPSSVESLKIEKQKDLLSANWEKEKAIETLAMEHLALERLAMS
jgi:hypothetical protein